jgi:site-specific recombinase
MESSTQAMAHSPVASTKAHDSAHFAVILDQCYQLLERLKRRGAGFGSSVAIAHLLERLEQTMIRIDVLVKILLKPRHDEASSAQEDVMVEHATLATQSPQYGHAKVDDSALQQQPDSIALDQLYQQLLISAAHKTSVRAFMRSSSQLLSRSITINASSHGEHYIAHDRPQFYRMFRSAAGAGVVIALMALHKIHIETLGLEPFWQALASSMNYGIGFVLIHVLHFTVATKQPAMTAASVAAAIEKNDQGRATHKKLAGLLIAVNRTQWAAVWGNVSLALVLSCVIAFVFQFSTGQPLLSDTQIAYQQHAILPWHGSLLFAAIAGVWLFLAGIIAGYFDNRANYLQLDLRLIHHPWLKRWLSADRRRQLAAYIHHNYGAIAGNLGFGFLLGMTPYLGYLLEIPLDIRHVAFASANLGFSGISADVAWWYIIVQLPLVLAIGFINLWVSFTLAIWIALGARNTKFSQLRLLGPSLWQQIKQHPRQLFIPDKR